MDTSEPRTPMQVYREEGFVVREALLGESELLLARERLAALQLRARTDPRFRFEADGADGSVERAPCYRAPEGEFFVQLEPGVDPSKGRVRKLMSFCEQDPALAALADRVGREAADLLGGPVTRFQDMALLKPPRGGEKPWHQDCAYFEVLPLEAVIGVWIALDEAEVDNGCMHVLPGAHREGPRRHRLARDCELDEPVPPGRVRAVPMAAGSALCFSGLLPHGTPPNVSRRPRRALQFHYRREDSLVVSRAEYDRVFVDPAGRPASCAAAADRR